MLVHVPTGEGLSVGVDARLLFLMKEGNRIVMMGMKKGNGK